MLKEEYLELNARLNLLGDDGAIQLAADKDAVRNYFLTHVNPKTQFFYTLEEKIKFMVSEGYWDGKVFDKYSYEEVKELFQFAYSFKHRFRTFVGAYKFYRSYACKTYDGETYLERYEDRVCMVALALAKDIEQARRFVESMIKGVYQPATPTFLNAGRGDSGELVSCFLLRLEDNFESILRAQSNAGQLSKRGGGVSLLLTNLREEGAPIKKVEGASSGVVPVMKILEDTFSYANQLGARQGAGAVYLHAHHPDIMKFLDTKRENADEKIRIKTLSLGVVIPDITFELARQGKDMYLFSPYDILNEYGKCMSDISITDMYDELVENPRIRKKKVNAREFFRTLAEIQFESGYPYIMFEDTVNRVNPNDYARINLSNLCSEVIQPNTISEFDNKGEYSQVGQDISCNLGSINIAKFMPELQNNKGYYHIKNAVEMLNAVVRESNLECVPSIKRGNDENRSIGLGQMNLHGYFMEQGIEYGSEESLDFTNVYFSLIKYWTLLASTIEASEAGSVYSGYEKSRYATGEALADYCSGDIDTVPVTPRVAEIFGNAPKKPEDWAELDSDIRKFGLYNSYLTAVPPTGNISYVSDATSSIHPVASPIEIRKEGKLGRVYYPAYGLTTENLVDYNDAYQIGYEKIIDVYAEATKHTDQGLSLTLFFTDEATTRDLNKAQIYAWKKGIKTLYYIRLRQQALAGTGVDSCVSCTL